MNLLNALPAMSIRRLVPWSGAWLADVDVELDATQTPPSGRCVLTIGASTLSGTIDDDASGYIGTKFRARVIAGGGGWHKKPSAQAYHSDGGVMSPIPIAATASSVGEVAVVSSPTNLGNDFVVSSQLPASQVFRGSDWHVNAQGITQVGPRVPSPVVDPDVHVLSFDGLTQTAEVATETLLEPGMVITDERFGTLAISQVEQTFGPDGSRATVWGSASGDPRSIGDKLGQIARNAVGLPALRVYRYRVVAQGGDGRLVLQAVSKAAGLPDQLPIAPWYGVPGASAKLAPGATVLLHFLEGDPGQPVVVSFDGTMPLEVDIAAPMVKLGLTPEPIAKGPETVAAFGAISTYCGAIAAAETTFTSSAQALPDIVVYLHAIGAATASLLTALGLATPLIPALTIQGGP